MIGNANDWSEGRTRRGRLRCPFGCVSVICGFLAERGIYTVCQYLGPDVGSNLKKLLTCRSLHAFVSFGAAFVSIATTRSIGINGCSVDTNPSQSNHTQGKYRPLLRWGADSMHNRDRSRRISAEKSEVKRLGRIPGQVIQKRDNEGIRVHCSMGSQAAFK